MSRKPAFWIAFAAVSLTSAVLALRLFPHAFPLVQLELTMDREAALVTARDLMAREQLGPPGYRQAASFTSDSQAQTFVELEGGGKEAYARMLREGLYSAYTWRVRHFTEGQKHETLIRFRPDGSPYGFEEQLEENESGAALAPDAARAIAEGKAQGAWHIDLSPFALVEQSQERRPGGRVDHRFTYERHTATLNEGRYRMRLVVSGDRLTEATHFIRIPEGFTRRYEEMRSANEAIGAASGVAVVVLYVVGGIAVGLFWLLRHRWVIARQPMLWGMAVGLLQVLSRLNDWPLLWMSYDTAVPRASFIGQQIAIVVASFVGFSMFFGLSFMAAESLTRRAFGHQPQLWRVWSREATASRTLLGHTATGYLLVAIFFAYEVLLYFYATRLFGWWAPSEALLHPDVLASYFPWLSAIANSFQAGFWEECLFRAVPIAGAALIGDRYGKRGLFVAVAFLVQAIVFGAGHAPYPTQPSYSRPVELMLPSIGFGLLYLAFGLLPGIILHYAFDVIWFALPLFVLTAGGIWIDRAMVIGLTLVPLWIVLAARVRTGAWLELRPELRNAAWIPPPAPAVPARVEEKSPVVQGLSPRFRRAWMLAGIAALVAWSLTEPFRTFVPPLHVSRGEAARVARETLSTRGFNVSPAWRVMPVIDNARGEGHRFVWHAAGEDRFRSLLGHYLPTPRWRVRVASFEGDVADRAEEWTVLVNERGAMERMAHALPESRSGPSLSEADARTLAYETILRTFRLSPSALREVSAQPSRLAKRTDWMFTFQDLTVEPIPMPDSNELASLKPGSSSAGGGALAPPKPASQANAGGGGKGEARIEIEIAGSEVTRARPFLRVPEQWERQERGRRTLSQIVRILGGVIAGGALLAAAVLGIVAWSRHQFAVRVFLGMFVLFASASLIDNANSWPSFMASLSTAQPFELQVLMLVGLGLIGLLIPSAMMALAAGVLPRWMPIRRAVPSSTAVILGISLGMLATAAASLARVSGEPPWPDASPLESYIPILATATGRIPALVLGTVTLMVLLSGVDHFTRGWTRRRVASAFLIIVAGAVLGRVPDAPTMMEWLMASVLAGMALLSAYVFLLRYDLSIAPIALATMIALAQLAAGVQGAFAGVLAGALAGIVLTAVVGWWTFAVLRRERGVALG